jgi:hypothetical protein
MQFLTMIKTDESQPAGPPPPALFEAIGAFGEECTKSGVLIEQGGLLPSAAGALITLAGGKVTVTDGPFAEAKELIGGFAKFQTRTKEEAVELARRFLDLHAEHWPGAEAVCEVRQIMEFPEA